MTNLTVATVNVNGLRAAVKKGMGKWFDSQREKGLDVLCLQETKISRDKDKEEIISICKELDIKDFHLQGDKYIPGHGGVAVWVKETENRKVVSVDYPFEGNEAEAKDLGFSGRWQEILIKLKSNNKEIMIVNSYYHSADEKKPKKMENKLNFFSKTTHQMRELSKCNNFILVGDINTMHNNIDIKAYEDNIKKAGFLPEERAWLDLWFATTNIESKAAMDRYKKPLITNYRLPEPDEFENGGLGLCDVIREKYGNGEDGIIYTFWSWKFKGHKNYENNAGRRIDYQIASKEMAELVKTMPEIYGYGKVSYEERWSDHAPVVVTYSM
jgi:exodeoxyribonuclease-3